MSYKMDNLEPQPKIGRLNQLFAVSKGENSQDNATKIANIEGIKGIDSECIYSAKNKLVRIKYPGIVQNLDKALETLGGMKGIEDAVSKPSNKLQLNFHPDNKYNKGCVAECNSNSGLLLKVKTYKDSDGKDKSTFDIVGATVRNFEFKKLIDFQYLPLVAEHPETSDSNVEYIYEDILPKKLPTLESVLKEKINMPLFLPPTGFSRADKERKITPFEKKNMNEAEQEPHLKGNVPTQCMAFVKEDKPSISHKFAETNVPQGPTTAAAHLFQKKNYQEPLEKLSKCFEERPIWTKIGLKHNTKLKNDMLKGLLPALAYYELTGPWRCTWIRFGYDPRKDPEARKFQSLDYRISSSVRTNLGIRSKKSVRPKSLPTSLEKLQIVEKDTRKNDENSYILRPNMLPRTHQIFYQYCDILLPEIQTMLARLPPVPPTTECDSKIGWFPTSFIEQCREIVNKYIDEFAAIELSKQRQSNENNFLMKVKKEVKSNDYCSLMIKNRKLGLSKQENSNLNESGPSTSYDTYNTSSIPGVTEIIDTDSDDSNDNFYEDEFIGMEAQENTDGDLLINTDYGLDIDVEALEDVIKIVHTPK